MCPTLPHEPIEGVTPYGASPELVSQIEKLLGEGKEQDIQTIVKALYPADVGDLITRFSPDSREDLVRVIEAYLDPEVIAHLEDQIKDEVLHVLGPQGVAAFLQTLESDDALHLIEDLDEEQQQEVLESIPAQDRAILEEVLTYPEDSAGRLMQREIVSVPPFWTVEEVLSYIRSSKTLPDSFYNVYIVDPRYQPIGVISLNKLLRFDGTQAVSEIMDKSLHQISVHMDQEEVANLFRHYALVSAPVVSEEGRIVGMITLDDVVDVIDEEAEEDIMRLSRVSESDFYVPTLKTSYLRSRWLLVSLINALIAAYVVNQFQGSIKENTVLSVVMIIVAAMGGNSGMQAVTVTVRALSTRDLQRSFVAKAIWKELAVATLMGSFFALLLGAIVSVWMDDLYMGIVLGVALFFNMLWAGFAGSSLPVLVRHFGMDPAISAGPLLATTTDVFGYAIFLGLATAFLV